jgi:imidazolonepropionase-like amidohydrolase
MHQLIEHAGISAEDAFKTVTRNPAMSLRRMNLGIMDKNAEADLIMWDLEDLSEIPKNYKNLSKHIIYVIKEGIFNKKSLNPKKVDK